MMYEMNDAKVSSKNILDIVDIDTTACTNVSWTQHNKEVVK